MHCFNWCRVQSASADELLFTTVLLVVRLFLQGSFQYESRRDFPDKHISSHEAVSFVRPPQTPLHSQSHSHPSSHSHSHSSSHSCSHSSSHSHSHSCCTFISHCCSPSICVLTGTGMWEKHSLLRVPACVCCCYCLHSVRSTIVIVYRGLLEVQINA